jgi:hypothetical protein
MGHRRRRRSWETAAVLVPVRVGLDSDLGIVVRRQRWIQRQEVRRG